MKISLKIRVSSEQVAERIVREELLEFLNSIGKKYGISDDDMPYSVLPLDDGEELLTE